ncbi:MAG: SusD/RagB family nutrient-binding outer membrane lipoprotein [Tannerella sp.]|jgi:hypothetical protein|nr:SusD/RagB family nutrient-binding outer membrane lipoprotein [Tannerella sp.]
MESVNTDPNNPADVPSNMLFSGTQKKMMDYVYDNWFSGRQCLLYAQYWAQRNYTEEDRYQIRESVNNSYFNQFYTLLANLDKVIEINTNPETATMASLYGANANQIAAAKTLKVWLLSVMTDTWGSIPYSEAGKLTENIYYPKYDDQATLYEEMIKELTAAANLFDEDDVAFTGGDMIYGGDASLWKKFANSLKCRLAIHTSKVAGSKWKTYIAEALASGVFDSNGDVAAYHYGTAPEYSYFYEGAFIQGRNDFTLTRPFIDILKGQRDTLNNKTHPWENVVDPRLPLYTTPRNGKYIGIPYGIPSNTMTAGFRNAAPDIRTNRIAMLQPDFAVPLMTYAEVRFIISEYNGFSADEYVDGVEASVRYWSDVAGVSVDEGELGEYIASVSANVDAEAVAVQKYIDLYMNGTEAWTEIRRTGYPVQLISPGEICVAANDPNNTSIGRGTDIVFDPLSDTKGIIIARVKYPTNESTLNGASFKEAVGRLESGTNNYYSPMFWDKRRTEGAHPGNK